MWIDALKIQGGVLDGFDQHFDRQLNVLIGGRGTGKSSVVELLRFCLGAEPYTEEARSVAIEHALGVLGDGRVTVVLTNGKEKWEVSRTANEQNPELDVAAAPFVFSQSEIETIGLQARSRRRLIDGFLRPPYGMVTSDRSTTSRIRTTTTEIRTLLSEIDDIGEKTANLPKLQAQLDALRAQAATQSKLNKEIEGHRLALTELTPLLSSARVRSEVIGRSAARLSTWVSEQEDLLNSKSPLEPWPHATTTDELADLRKREAAATARLRAGWEELASIAGELEKRGLAAGAQRGGLENRAREIRQKIEDIQKGASALDRQISDLAQQIGVLNSLTDLRKERALRVEKLVKLRDKAVAEQDEVRQALTDSRQQIASKLSQDLGPSVRVSISPFADHRDYVAALSASLRGSGLKYAEIAERIATTFSPQEIASYAEARDFETIASGLEITKDRALRLADALRGPAGAALFTTTVEDEVQMELMDGSDYKGIDFLSMGQRCTVVLPIILRHTERIIVLDQPEDHLDNSFVVGTLVKALGGRATGAQSIVATHNANIPVLGAAAKVFHLESDGSRCFVRASGPIDTPAIVDAITTIMEGGREAFARRADFYSKNLPNARTR